MNDKYLTPERVCQILNITSTTLRTWSDKGKIECIRTQGGHRRFLLKDIITIKDPENISRKKYCYCRVSSAGQKDDLQRQVEYLSSRFPDHEILKDIGSGLNFKRKNFNTILEQSLKGNIQELVVTHKDRLCRFGFEIVEKNISTYGGKIVVLDTAKYSPEQELTNDLISIITCFSSRIYGLRSGKIKRAIKDLQNTSEVQDDEVPVVSD